MNFTLPAFTASVHHDGSSRYVQNQTASGLEPRLGDDITIRLRAAPGAPIERVLLRTCPDGEQHLAEMHRQPGMACQWWEGMLLMSMPLVAYRFLLLCADGVYWLNGTGVHRHSPTDADDFRLLADYAAPTWVRDSVFYQIFPDRFADGDPASNVRDGEYEYWGMPTRARRWGEPSHGEYAAGKITFGRLEIARCDTDPSQPEHGQINFIMEGGL